MANENFKQVKLGQTGKIELQPIDVSIYVGRDAKIDSVEELEGSYGFFVQIKTEVLETLKQKDKKGNPIQIVATKNLGLQTDAEGKTGWGEGTKMDLFLKKMKVNHYNELVGKKVKVITTTADKDGRAVDFLTF